MLENFLKKVDNAETYFNDLIKFQDEIYDTNLEAIQKAIDTRNIGFLESFAMNIATEIGVKLIPFISLGDNIRFLENLFEDKLKYISLLSTCQSSKSCFQTSQVLNLLSQIPTIPKKQRPINSDLVTRKLDRNDLLLPLLDLNMKTHQQVRFLTSPENNWLYASFTIPQHEFIILGEVDSFGACESFHQVQRTWAEDTFSVVTSWDPCE